MVNFVIDNLLLSTENRVFYETLWSLVLHKKKVGQQKYHAICLVQICNDLLKELNNDKQNKLDQKNRFYFTTQIAFGAIQVYKLQIDKLFNQVKHALATCTSKAFEFDWLSSSQSTSVRSVKKGKVRKVGKVIENDVLLECQALECLDDEEFKFPQPVKKVKKVQSFDPNIVINSRTITLLETFHPTPSNVDCSGNEFGVMTAEDFETFCEPDQSQESERSTILNCTISKKRKIYEDFPDDIPRSSSPSKRAKSCEIFQDLSHTVDQILHDSSIFDSGTSQVNIIENDSLTYQYETNPPVLEDVSSFDSVSNQVNIIENDSLTYQYETNPPVLENTENFDLNSEISPVYVEEMVLPKIDHFQLKRKAKQINKCIVVDKRMKITNKIGPSSSFDQYKKLYTEDLPRENFDQMIYKHKFGVDILFKIPSRTNMSAHLILLVKKNLKKIPQTVIDRKNIRKALIVDETTPISKRTTTRMNPGVIKRSGEKINNTILDSDLADQEDDVLKSTRMQLYFNDDEFVINEPVANLNAISHNTFVDEYDEDKKWSQEMIMERLEVLWNTEEQQINMQKLCGRMNRFVCAGIFFELLNLSKVGLITLQTKNGHPEIYHIERN